MTDLDLLITGVVVTFIAVTGAYIAMRHRANETPVDSYKGPETNRAGYDPALAEDTIKVSPANERAALQPN